MVTCAPKVTYDKWGTPGLWAADDLAFYRGLGYLHGMHRPLQTLLLATAARGHLAARLWPTATLCQLDTLVHKLDLPDRAAGAAQQMRGRNAARLDAFVAGMGLGLKQRRPLRLLSGLGLLRLSAPDRTSVLAGLMLSSYLGLAQCQDRMERALVACVQAGADTEFLQTLHAPHLLGWDPVLLRRVRPPADLQAVGSPGRSGGSNAWAVTGARTASGSPLLCGDPHLQINQLPALFFEVRAWVGNNFLLGASIPGLPGMAVGRNRTLAFTGTFSCGDNIDSVVECVKSGDRLARGGGDIALQRRRVWHVRRARRGQTLHFAQGPRGVLDAADVQGLQLATAWCSAENVAAALGAYMQLPFAADVAEAQQTLALAHTLSLHYVLADRGGVIAHQQAGTVPKRTHGWSGLYPVAADGPAQWDGLYRGAALGGRAAEDGMVISANEPGTACDGTSLATLAQPSYRRRRIAQLLAPHCDHTVQSMQAIQHDLHSLQGQRLRPALLRALPDGPVRRALAAWDLQCDQHSVGAHAFELAYRAALGGLASALGGKKWSELMALTEIRVWWCAALDRCLAEPHTWQSAGPVAAQLAAALKQVASLPPEPWGKVQRFAMPHMLFGVLPGVSAGAQPLPGSIATIAQGNLVPGGAATVAVGPAYRMVCDLGEDALTSTLPGGIDDHPAHASYTQWLPDWHAGIYHRLTPPHDAE